MFYNVENLFDIDNDTLTADDEFTPDGVRRWSFTRWNQKTNRIAKVIIASGEEQGVGMVGLCEIENRNVLNRLVFDSPLRNLKYSIIHKESPDKRGIDVALLYKPKVYQPLENRFIPVTLAGDTTYKTRDILYTKGILLNTDTLHVFVNHWPSRYGGVSATIPLRCNAAQKLKHITDSVLSKNPNANIVIMGDFNDYPNDESLTKCLGATEDGKLINLAMQSADEGSYKHNGRWDFLDQFIVSRHLVYNVNSGLKIGSPQKVVILPFLLEPDEKFTGNKPFRTFDGYKYRGGYSDHLPVMVTINATDE